MRAAFLLLAAIAFLYPHGTAAAQSTRVYAEPAGRVLEVAHIIPAPRAEVWAAFSTSEGLRSFAAPVIEIDLRRGGLWESSYDPAAAIGDEANIRNRVLAYLPERMLTIAVERAPPGFQHAQEVRSLFTVITFDDAADGATRVTVWMLGYGEGPAYDALLHDFARGNAWTLQQLERRFREGPRANYCRAISASPTASPSSA